MVGHGFLLTPGDQCGSTGGPIVKPLLTAQEVAALLKVKPSWVYAQARADRIPHVRLGRYTRFDAESIASWTAERERGSVGRGLSGQAGTGSMMGTLPPLVD